MSIFKSKDLKWNTGCGLIWLYLETSRKLIDIYFFPIRDIQRGYRKEYEGKSIGLGPVTLMCWSNKDQTMGSSNEKVPIHSEQNFI